MGNRLERFGLGGFSANNESAKAFIKQNLLSVYASQAAGVPRPTGSLGTGPGSPGFNPLTYKAPTTAEIAARRARINAERAKRGLGPLAPINPLSTKFVGGTGVAQGAEALLRSLFGVGLSSDIPDLFENEEAAYAALDDIFSKNPNLGQELFKDAQGIANNLQSVRDDKISGGKIGGPLKVLTAALTFPGSAFPGAATIAAAKEAVAAKAGSYFGAGATGSVAAANAASSAAATARIAGMTGALGVATTNALGSGLGTAATGVLGAGANAATQASLSNVGSGGSTGVTTPFGSGGLTTAQGAGFGATVNQATGGLGNLYQGPISPLVGQGGMTLAGTGGASIGYSPLAVLGGTDAANATVQSLANTLGSFQGGNINETNVVLGTADLPPTLFQRGLTTLDRLMNSGLLDSGLLSGGNQGQVSSGAGAQRLLAPGLGNRQGYINPLSIPTTGIREALAQQALKRLKHSGGLTRLTPIQSGLLRI